MPDQPKNNLIERQQIKITEGAEVAPKTQVVPEQRAQTHEGIFRFLLPVIFVYLNIIEFLEKEHEDNHSEYSG